MLRALLPATLIPFIVTIGSGVAAQDNQHSKVIVFSEPGFRAADSAAPAPKQLSTLVPTAAIVGTDQLSSALTAADSRLSE